MMGERPARLALTVDSGTMRSLSASPQPGAAGLPNMHQHSLSAGPVSPGGSMQLINEDSSYGEQEESNFGKAKKSKRKAAPRTSRACLACRRQKMRCEGADDPPCKRCISNEVDCMFERRSDYLLNPEDRAWQNGVEKRLEHLGKAIDQILAHLGAGGLGPMPTAALPPPATAAAAFQDMPQTAFYDGHYDRGQTMMPQTAPITTDMPHPGRVNYVVPAPGETAAIAAQSRFKRPRSTTVPSNLSSGGYTPDTAFQLFSPNPRTGGLHTSGLPTPYEVHTGGSGGHGHPHHAGQQPTYSHSSQSYHLDSYADPSMDPNAGHGQAHGHHQQHPGHNVHQHHDLGTPGTIPRSLNSPQVRFATTPVPMLQAAPHGHEGHHDGEQSQAGETLA